MALAFILALHSLAAGEVGPAESPLDEARLLAHTRQLTFEGQRSGEGYFDAQGRRLIFQSEREPGNPFYQIYLMDLENGDSTRISPGSGKSTCGFFRPDGKRVLFASTHDDPQAADEQAEEIEFRSSGRERRYSWDYDEHFEIYSADSQGGDLRRLTEAQGYDAEASYSPDGNWIVFASNRHAYSQELSDEDRAKFELDKSYLVDLYLLKEDGSGVRRLTTAPGYDGGPFFSPDGRRIVWRRFSEDGALAEIYTMSADGSDEQAITRMGAMSWAPFYHPSGRYLIFSTNRHGFGNFELYLVDSEGRKEPVRVTFTDGFDGLAVFSPDGRRLSWTSNRTPEKRSQIFVADWDHAAALGLLGLEAGATAETGHLIETPLPETQAAIRADDLRAHVAYLASDELGGRMTGSAGERLAAEYLAASFKSMGLLPVGDNGGYFQEFEFTAGVSLGADNRLDIEAEGGRHAPLLDRDWRPLGFSSDGSFDAAEVVFAGYGLSVPAAGDQEEYDSYVHLDVQGKWVLVLRYLPENVSPERRRHLFRNSALPFKAILAREKGAKGLIVVSGPNSKVRTQLAPLQEGGAMAAGSGIAALSVSDEVAADLLRVADEDLQDLQNRLDDGSAVMGFAVPGLRISAHIELEKRRAVGRNVLARLPAEHAPAAPAVLIGAHFDHLGLGDAGGSLADHAEQGQIHNGADDNASGTAGVLEIAQYLAGEKGAGRLNMRRDAIFAAWSGEELGLVGSSRYVESLSDSGDLSTSLAAYLNMDMIGRLGDKLVLQGVGSSSDWPGIIERRNAPVGLALTLQESPYLPTDATSFYTAKVPVLSAFTGSHSEYHSPRDTADLLNYPGTEQVVRLMSLVARDLLIRPDSPQFVAMKAPEQGRRGGLRAYLGSIPEYSQGDEPGVRLSGVSPGGPAERAGIKRGDVIVELAGRKIENIYDYTYAIEALKIGEAVEMIVLRNNERVRVKITPASRD